MASLSNRLKHLIENKKSDEETSSLYLFAAIYSKASKECYVDYMQGAKALFHWLSPKGEALTHSYSKQELELFSKLPLYGYEISQAAWIAGAIDKLPHLEKVAASKLATGALVAEFLKVNGYEITKRNTSRESS